jgi:hypothetical protein
MLADLATPVGELGDAPAQRVDRSGELLALKLDVLANLGGRPGSRRHSARRAEPRALGKPRAPGTSDLRSLGHDPIRSPERASRASFASSMAISGTGGAASFIER